MLDASTTLRVPASRAAWTAFQVPITLVPKYALGLGGNADVDGGEVDDRILARRRRAHGVQVEHVRLR